MLTVDTDPKKLFKFSIEQLSCHSQCFRALWTVPKDLPFFEGHFPNQPVLPAVSIIEASAEFLNQALKQNHKLKSAKFMGLIAPNFEVEISLHQNTPTELSVVWKKSDDETILAKVEF